MRIGWLAVLLFACLIPDETWADIDVKPQYEPNEPIVATVTITDVPAGAKLRGSFAVSDGSYLPASPKDSGENVYHVWAGPGTHKITAQGVWVLTQDVVVGEQTVPVLVDFGQFSYARTFTVGEVPDPDPFPQPDPQPNPQSRKAVILKESADQTPTQAILWEQLRKEFQPDRLQILDDDQPKAAPYLPLVKTSVRPVLLVLTEQGKLIRESTALSSVDGVKQEIAR